MQSDVTLVGGTTPAARLTAPVSTQTMAAQASNVAPAALASGQAVPRPSSTTQTAAVAAAKIALSVDGSPTALSQAERVLKPYNVTMLPEPPVEGSVQDAEDADKKQLQVAE